MSSNKMLPTTIPARVKRRKDGTFDKGGDGVWSISPRAKCITYMDRLIYRKAEDLVNKTIVEAMKGDMTAMRLLFDRVYPQMEGRPVMMAGFEGKNAMEIADLVIKGMCEGIISPKEALEINKVIEQKLTFDALEKSNVIDEIEKKIEVLENE